MKRNLVDAAPLNATLNALSQHSESTLERHKVEVIKPSLDHQKRISPKNKKTTEVAMRCALFAPLDRGLPVD